MTMEKRLKRLELSHRRLKAILSLIVAGHAAVLLMGAIDPNMPSIVRAGRFQLIGGEDLDRVLVDILATPEGDGAIMTFGPEGRPRTSLRPRADGNGWVTTYDRNGIPLVELGAGRGGAGTVSTSNPSGRQLVALAPTIEGGGGVFTFNDRGLPVAEIGTTEQGHGRIRTLDGAGQAMVVLAATEQGAGTIGTRNSAGHDVARIAVDADGRALVGAYDGAGNLLRQWPVGDDGSTASFSHVVRARAFEVVDREQTGVLVRATQDENGAGIVTLYDAAGRTLVEARATPDGGTVVEHRAADAPSEPAE